MLTPEQRSAVSFITYIEDHLPGYFAAYHALFPLDESTPLDQFEHNREVYHFGVRWAQEEDAHAHVLQLYQLRSGMAQPDSLRRALAEEGRKDFSLLREFQPIEFFTYTLVQEKATQIYYQKLAQVVTEPVLQSILQTLARDEARHFAFFSRVLGKYVETYGAAVFPVMQNALVRFKMPLATTLKNYWRWSIRISETANNYDYLEAFPYLLSTIRRAADAATWKRASDLESYVNRLSGA